MEASLPGPIRKPTLLNPMMFPEASLREFPRNATPPPFFTIVFLMSVALARSLTTTPSNRLRVITFRSNRTSDSPAMVTPWSLSWMKFSTSTATVSAN